jgi:4-diphosphocytidyl-2-C-methyl-D-erythritol kinase
MITPGIHVSTADAYRALNRELTSAGPRNDFQAVTWNVSEGYENDFESVVFRQHSHLKLIKGKLLNLGARPALMSGSGSTIFGIFPSRELRDRAAGWFRREFAADQVHPVSLVRRSQYRAMWRRQLGLAFGIKSVDNKLWPWQSQDRYAQ